MDTEQTRLLPASMMARRLGVTTSWLISEAEAGNLPGLKADRTVLFNPVQVERMLFERATGSDLFVSPRRTARLIGVSEAFLRREVVHGRVPHLKDGARILLNPEAVRGALLDRDSMKTDAGNRAKAAST